MGYLIFSKLTKDTVKWGVYLTGIQETFWSLCVGYLWQVENTQQWGVGALNTSRKRKGQ